MQEAVAESVIQRFETCYDCLWKILKRYLMEQLGLPDIPNSPRPIFRYAFENKLLTPPLDRWMHYAHARINTSHDYCGKKALNCLQLINDFIGDAILLYQIMSGEKWKK